MQNNSSHGWPGLVLLGISATSYLTPGDVLVFVQIFAGMAAGAFYIKKLLDKKDKE